MPKPLLLSFVLAAGLAIGLLINPLVDAAPSKPKPKTLSAGQLYDKGMAAVKAKDYEKALEQFQAAEKLEPRNADALNMIAYSNRKLGRLKVAFTYYNKALAVRERFPEAREYLGEAHLQAAILQAQVLESYGDEGSAQLAELVHAFEAATAALKENRKLSEIDRKRW